MGLHEAIYGRFTGASGQTISAAAASTDTIRLSSKAKPQIGVGPHSPMLCIRVRTAPTAATDTLSIELQQDADDGAGSPAGSWTTVEMLLCGAAGAEVLMSDARLATAGAWVYRGRLPYNVTEPHIRLYFNNTTSVGTIVLDAWVEDEAASDFRGSQVISSNVGNPA